MTQIHNNDLIDYLVDQVVERLAQRILGPIPPPVIHPSEYDLLIALGKSMTNPEIAEQMGVKVGIVANKVGKLAKRTGMMRNKLAQYGALLGIAIEGKQPLSPKLIQILDHEEEDEVA